MRWPRKYTLVAGIALIAGSNAIALLGVWYNRSGETESALRLTQRELAPPYWHGIDREGGGLELRLQWRVLTRDVVSYYPTMGGAPDWLDRAKLVALGFDMSARQDSAAGKRYYEGTPSRQVYVVLEYDGAAYQEALRRAQAYAENPPAQRLPSTGANSPAEWLKREQTTASRLFVVDAGLDPAALRSQYPDRNRYAIARGRVRISFYAGNATRSAQLTGYLSEVINERISVPPEFRPMLGAVPRMSTWGEVSASRFEIDLAFGRRFEPWIVAVSNAENKK